VYTNDPYLNNFFAKCTIPNGAKHAAQKVADLCGRASLSVDWPMCAIAGLVLRWLACFAYFVVYIVRRMRGTQVVLQFSVVF
jgi:hypothetical protein